MTPLLKAEKKDLLAFHRTKARIQEERGRSHVAAAACEGFCYRVIEALLPSAEGTRGQQHRFPYVCVCIHLMHVFKTVCILRRDQIFSLLD